MEILLATHLGQLLKIFSFKENAWRFVIFYILLNSVVWWGVFCFARHSLDTSDMIENYAWGVHWQWGNNKHPPLFGWIVAAWFSIFPVADEWYYLLNEVNLACAFILLAAALRCILPVEKVLIVIVLTTMVAQFGPDSGFKYNANTALLPFLAGFLWALLKALQSGRQRYFIAAGLFSGAALLCKYYAVIPLAAISIVLLYPARLQLKFIFKGSLILALTGAIIFLPHVMWCMRHGWPSLSYMHSAHPAQGLGDQLSAYLMMLYGGGLFSAVAIIVWVMSWRDMNVLHLIYAGKEARLGLGILVISIIFTIISSWVEGLSPVASWLIPALLFLGWALVDIVPHLRLNQIVMSGFFYLFVALVGGMTLSIKHHYYPARPFYEMQKQVVLDITDIYHRAYRQPFSYAVGTFPMPYAMAFYSPDHPTGTAGLDLQHSYWASAEGIQEENKVAICGGTRPEDKDRACEGEVRHLFGEPDKIIYLNYKVYDPRYKTVVGQSYEALFWVRHSLVRISKQI